MALPMIETGYKPEFGLGAVYQGFNAAHADMSAEEELVKQFLANQREQQMQPLDINVRKTDSARADVQRTPAMLDALARGYIGQMNSQDAAGRKAMETAQGDIDLTNAGNRNKLTTEQLLARLNALKNPPTGTGTIGFPTQPQVTSVPVEGTNFFGNFAKGSPQDNLKAINTIKDPVERKNALAAFKAYQEQVPSQPQAVNTNNSPLVPLPPKRNGGITQGGPEYEAVMQALVDTPELRRDLLKGDQKLDSAEYQKILALQEAEKKRAGAGGKDPYLEFYKLTPEKRLGVMEWAINSGINPVTREPFREGERESFISLYNQDLATYNARNASNAKEGSIPLTELTEGKIPTRPAVTAGTPKAVGGNELKTQVEQSGVAYEPDKYDYRVVDGKVQRKLKGK